MYATIIFLYSLHPHKSYSNNVFEEMDFPPFPSLAVAGVKLREMHINPLKIGFRSNRENGLTN